MDLYLPPFALSAKSTSYPKSDSAISNSVFFSLSDKADHDKRALLDRSSTTCGEDTDDKSSMIAAESSSPLTLVLSSKSSDDVIEFGILSLAKPKLECPFTFEPLTRSKKQMNSLVLGRKTKNL